MAMGNMMKVFRTRVGPNISLQTDRQHLINLFKALCCAVANVAVLHLQSGIMLRQNTRSSSTPRAARTLAEPCNQAYYLNTPKHTPVIKGPESHACSIQSSRGQCEAFHFHSVLMRPFMSRVSMMQCSSTTGTSVVILH